jgi:hypothetical protein
MLYSISHGGERSLLVQQLSLFGPHADNTILSIRRVWRPATEHAFGACQRHVKEKDNAYRWFNFGTRLKNEAYLGGKRGVV